MPITQKDLEFRENLTSRLTGIEGKIDVLHAKLEPILLLQTTVKEHDRQIQRWIGVNAVLSGLFAITVSVLASMYAKLRHWM